MFSKSGSAPSVSRERTLSLTARLAWLYILSSSLLLGGILFAIHLYFESSLARQNDRFLADKIHALRAIIEEHPTNTAAWSQEIELESGAQQFAKFYARISEPVGAVLVQTPGMEGWDSAGVRFPPPTRSGAVPAEGETLHLKDGSSLRLRSAYGWRSESERDPVLLQVALDISFVDQLTRRFHRILWTVMAAGILLSAAAGIFIARRGLRPLAEIVGRVRLVTAARLDERIGARPWPSELSALAEAFDAMLERLEASFQRLSRFSADLAHELRTPLNTLRVQSEVMLARARTPEEYAQTLTSGLEEMDRLSRMVDSLLFLARAENQETPLRLERVDARAAIEALRDYYEPLASERGISMECRGTGLVTADPLLFRRAVDNLLSNALQYTPPGGGVDLEVEAREGEGTEVRVKDTGRGIPPGEQDLIFDRFYRVDGARPAGSPGWGLGLSIVRSIMELHGGAVRLESVPGRGTTFMLWFPDR